MKSSLHSTILATSAIGGLVLALLSLCFAKHGSLNLVHVLVGAYVSGGLLAITLKSYTMPSPAPAAKHAKFVVSA